jgi:hypothetical protein
MNPLPIKGCFGEYRPFLSTTLVLGYFRGIGGFRGLVHIAKTIRK